MAYLEFGPQNGEPIVAVHGFPDDPYTWEPVAELLAADGARVIAPYLRGFGGTRVRDGVPLTGEIAALARDVVELLDALGIAKVHYIGHDWGARAGYAAAALHPERFHSLTALAVAYGTNVASQAMSYDQTRAYWYQWFFATPRGERALESDRSALCRELWRLWSPGWKFDDADFARTASSFDTPQFVPIVLSSYRQRWGFAPGAEAYAADRAALENVPPLAVPVLTIMGADDGATLRSSTEGKERLLAGPYHVAVVQNCGHFIQRERPAEAVAFRRAFLSGL